MQQGQLDHKKLELSLQRDLTSRISSVKIFYGQPLQARHSQQVNTKQIDINTMVINYLNELKEKTYRGIPLSQLLVHKDWGLWQYLPSYLFYHLRLSIELIERLEDIITIEKPHILKPFDTHPTDQSIWQTCIEELCRISGLGLDASSLSTQRINKWVRRLKDMGIKRPSFVQEHSKLRKSGAQLGHPFLNASPHPGSIMFVSSPTYWVQASSQNTYCDEQMSPIAHALRELGEHNLTGIDTPYYTHGRNSIEQLRHKIANDTQIRWGVFDAFENSAVNKVTQTAFHTFKDLWKELKNQPDFQSLFNYRKYRLWPILYTQLQSIFLKTLPEIVREIETASRIIDIVQPKAIVLTYEQGPYQRSLILEAARRNIPTVGLQHGAYVRNSDDMGHTDITSMPTKNPYGFAVPTITCTYGPFYKDSLTQIGHYLPESIMVSGNWRYDDSYQTQNLIPQNDLRTNLGIKQTTSKIVSILTSGLDSVQHIKTCLQALQSLKDIEIVIKFHPRETTQVLCDLIEKFALPNCQIIQDRLQDILRVSDLIITEDSCTTVVEAALFDKSSIVGSYDHRIWDSGFTEAGICLKANNVEEMKSAIKKILYDGKVQTEMASARPNFLFDRFYRQDGKAAQRVAEKIVTLAHLENAQPPPQSTH